MRRRCGLSPFAPRFFLPFLVPVETRPRLTAFESCKTALHLSFNFIFEARSGLVSLERQRAPVIVVALAAVLAVGVLQRVGVAKQRKKTQQKGRCNWTPA